MNISHDPLNPLTSPGRRGKGICKILRLVHNLTVAELHNTYCKCLLFTVVFGIFRYPEITISEHSPNLEA